MAPFSFGDHVDEFRDRFPRVPPIEAEAFVWQAIKDVFTDRSWSFAVATGYITTEASYSTGTVLLSNGSTSVTLTGGAWVTSWTTAPSSRRFAGQGRSENYGITITGATTGTLDTAWAGADAAEATYVLYRDVYELPSDCDHGQAVFILDTTNNRMLRQVDYGIFVAAKVSQNLVSATGLPACVTAVATTSTGLAQLQFGPMAPANAEIYTVLYHRSPAKPSGPTSVITPAFPVRYEDVIWRRAVWQAAAHPRYRRPEWAVYQAEYYDRLFEAASKFDGRNEITRILKGTIPRSGYDYTGSGYDYLDYAVNIRAEYV